MLRDISWINCPDIFYLLKRNKSVIIKVSLSVEDRQTDWLAEVSLSGLSRTDSLTGWSQSVCSNHQFRDQKHDETRRPTVQRLTSSLSPAILSTLAKMKFNQQPERIACFESPRETPPTQHGKSQRLRSLWDILMNTAPVGNKIHIDWLWFTVKQYRPQVIRCYKCQGFMHTAINCYKKDDICPSCAGRHKFGMCPVQADVEKEKKCANCHGPHSSAVVDVRNIKSSRTFWNKLRWTVLHTVMHLPAVGRSGKRPRRTRSR